MENKKKMIFNVLFLFLVFAATLYGVFHGEDLSEIAEILKTVNLYWLLPGVACVIIFIWGESIIIFYMMHTLGIHLKKWNLFPVLVGWILFQLYHTLCVGGTAGSDILYEEKEDTDPCLHTGSAHSDDHLQAGAGTSGTWNSYIWTEFYTYIYR